MSSSAEPGKIIGRKKPLIAHKEYLVKQRNPSLCPLDGTDEVCSAERMHCSIAFEVPHYCLQIDASDAYTAIT
jgi:hypothetical protein